MNKTYKSWLIFFICVSFYSCIGSAYQQKIVEGYYLSALDISDQMEIVVIDSQDYTFTVVPAKVVAVGNNERYIIAQRIETVNTKSEKETSNYYIIPIVSKPTASSTKNVVGPLTIDEFELKKKELNIQVALSNVP